MHGYGQLSGASPRLARWWLDEWRPSAQRRSRRDGIVCSGLRKWTESCVEKPWRWMVCAAAYARLRLLANPGGGRILYLIIYRVSG